MIKNNVNNTINRTRAFTNANNGALIQVQEIASMQVKKRPLNSYNLPYDMETYLDDRVDNFLKYWDQRKHIDDDLYPATNPWYGIAEHTAFVGGDVDFSETTSWHHQVLKDYDQFDKLSLDENNIYLKLVLEGMSYLKEKAKGQFFIKFRGADGPMDIANVIRGNDLFYDFYENPDELKKLMTFCSDAALFTLKKQLKLIDRVDNGIITGFDIWLPGNSIGHISEDASTMISNAHYREFGRPYTERITEQFEHAFMHIHSLGAYILPDIVTIKNIDYIEISNDPNSSRAIEVYKGYEQLLRDKVTVVLLTHDEIKDNKEFLKRNKTIIWYEATDEQDALKTIDIVREINEQAR